MDYESMVNLIPDIIYRLDAEGKFIFINDTVRNLGYEPEDLISKHYSILIHPEDVPRVRRDSVLEKMKKTNGRTTEQPMLFDERRTGKRLTKDLQIRLIPRGYEYRKDSEKDDKDIVASCRVIAMGAYYRKDSLVQMEFNGTVGVIKDIVNFRQPEEILHRYIEYYRTLTENSHVTFMVLSIDGTILFASPSIRVILGYQASEITGENITDYIYADDLAQVVRSYESTTPDRPRFKVNCRIRGNGRAGMVLELIGTTVFDERGRPLYITILSSDVTRSMEAEGALSRARDEMEERTGELSRANERLRMEIKNIERREMILIDTEKKYRNLVNSVDDLVFNLDPEGIIMFINPAVEKLIGYSQNEVIGRSILEFIIREDMEHLLKSDRHPEYHSPVERNALVEKICGNAEVRMIRKDGTNVWVEIRCNAVEDPDGRVILLRGVAHDITPRRRTEEELMRASTIDSLGILAGGIAHDFNNYLTAILGNISLARLSLPRESESYSVLADAEKASLMAKNLTQQLLSFSKEGKSVRINSSLQNLLMDTAYFVLSGSSIKGEYHLPDTLWDVYIDRGQISQVFHNILLNARQSMPGSGAITIRAENTVIKDGDPQLGKGDYIRIIISDQGCGIPEEIISKIFDPYFTTKESGSGLGLAISYTIIKKHMGHIQVESRKGHGAVFTVYIPAIRGKTASLNDAAPVKDFQGGKILLMDDEIIIQNMAGKLLRRLGFEAECASHGEEAVRLFRKAIDDGRPFACVLLDLIIPNGQGAEKTLAALREIDPEVRAIVTSGYVNDPVMCEYKSYGFHGALGKPFNMEDLERVLNLILAG